MSNEWDCVGMLMVMMGGNDYQECGCCVIGNIVGGIVTSVSGEMDEQKMVFGNAGHFQTLVEIIYFFPPALHPSSTGHTIAIISTLLLLQKND